jgi:hypothetical protein
MVRCTCPVCRADALVRRIGWGLLAFTALYFATQILRTVV